jgi:hypothetical protein
VSSGSPESGPCAPEHLVEEPPKLLVQVLRRLLEHLRQLVGLEHADLAVEALEEAHVARLVGDLVQRKIRWSSVGAARMIGPAPRHPLLANEESGQPVHALKPLLLVEALVPVLPVAAEVEVLGRPLLALPKRVELLVVEELHLGGAVRGLLQGGVGRGLVVRALGARGGGRRRRFGGLHSYSSQLALREPTKRTGCSASRRRNGRRSA